MNTHTTKQAQAIQLVQRLQKQSLRNGKIVPPALLAAAARTEPVQK